jgi:transposase-like protein
MDKTEILFSRDKNGHISRSQPRQPIQDLVSVIETGQLSFTEAKKMYKITSPTLTRWMRIYGKDPVFQTTNRRSREEKVEILLAVSKDGLTLMEASRKYQVSTSAIEKWRKELCFADLSQKQDRKGMVDNSEGEKESRQEIAELKMKVLALETMLDIAERELSFPIRKKYGTKQ